MIKFWRNFHSRKNDTGKQKVSILDDISIANANVSYLAERIEFFLPNFKKTVPFTNILYYVFAWSICVCILGVLHGGIDSFTEFILLFVREFLEIIFVVKTSLAVLDAQRQQLQSFSTWQVCLFVCLLVGILSILSTSVLIIIFGHSFGSDISFLDLMFKLLLSTSLFLGMTISLLVYYLSSYWQLIALVDAFEVRLAAQNELLRARMSPHFFFNTINGLTSLVETDPQKASAMLSDISMLFRASFDESTEINFEQEIELCRVFLHIDEMRFQGKLNINWDLPDEDTMYDMTITTLTLQSVLEKMLHRIVEITIETIDVTICVRWEKHMVKIDILVDLPQKTMVVRHDLNHQMNFVIQEQRLKKYFGEKSTITSFIDEHIVKVNIRYPLHDPGIPVAGAISSFESRI